MEKKLQQKRRKYDADFKREVLNMVFHGRSVLDISQSLGIGANLIHKWKSRAYPQATVPLKVTKAEIKSVSYAEHEKLKARFKQLEQERDILKKALGIFSRED